MKELDMPIHERIGMGRELFGAFRAVAEPAEMGAGVIPFGGSA